MISLEASLSRLTKPMRMTLGGSLVTRRQSPGADPNTSPVAARASKRSAASVSVSPMTGSPPSLTCVARLPRRGAAAARRPAERVVPPPRQRAQQQRQQQSAHDSQPERHPQHTLQHEEEKPEPYESGDDDDGEFHD